MPFLFVFGEEVPRKPKWEVIPDAKFVSIYYGKELEARDEANGMIRCPAMTRFDLGGRMVDRDYCMCACFGRGCRELNNCWKTSLNIDNNILINNNI